MQIYAAKSLAAAVNNRNVSASHLQPFTENRHTAKINGIRAFFYLVHRGKLNVGKKRDYRALGTRCRGDCILKVLIVTHNKCIARRQTCLHLRTAELACTVRVEIFGGVHRSVVRKRAALVHVLNACAESVSVYRVTVGRTEDGSYIRADLLPPNGITPARVKQIRYPACCKIGRADTRRIGEGAI